MSIVWCKLPKAGLGNQLFPLLKAHAFAHVNDLPLLITGYHQLKIGPYLRGEKSKRRYANSFTFQKNIFGAMLDTWKVNAYKKYILLDEPALLTNIDRADKLYRFSAIPHWDDYFNELKDKRELVIQLFWNLLTDRVMQKVEQGEEPVIGVHIRMGDFRTLAPGEDFRRVGAVRTPQEYFIDVIGSIRKIKGVDLPVSIFTDGFGSELEQLTALRNVKIIEGNTDIVDLALLSKSKIIVTSAGSTFSYWAGFLSNVPLIMHPDHIHKSIRPANIGHTIYEGPYDINNNVLVENIKSITVEKNNHHAN